MKITASEFTAHLRAEQQTALDKAKLARMDADALLVNNDFFSKAPAALHMETVWRNTADSIGTWIEDIRTGRARVPHMATIEVGCVHSMEG